MAELAGAGLNAAAVLRAITTGAVDAGDGPRLRRGLHLGRTAWPLLVLVVLVVANAIVTPGFGAFELRDGRLHGALVDVLHRGTPVMLLALGMTLVIGAGGIDLSVGAVMAIVGAVVARLLAETRFGVVAAVSPAAASDLRSDSGTELSCASPGSNRSSPRSSS